MRIDATHDDPLTPDVVDVHFDTGDRLERVGERPQAHAADVLVGDHRDDARSLLDALHRPCRNRHGPIEQVVERQFVEILELPDLTLALLGFLLGVLPPRRRAEQTRQTAPTAVTAARSGRKRDCNILPATSPLDRSPTDSSGAAASGAPDVAANSQAAGDHGGRRCHLARVVSHSWQFEGESSEQPW